MPLLLDSHDFLPYIDHTTEAQFRSAAAVLSQEVAQAGRERIHPSIPTDYTPIFSELLTAAHEHVASTGSARAPDTGIDLTRYEEPSPPSDYSDRKAWRNALQAAYVSQTYLHERQLNLSLLDRYGKNAWLIGNFQVEQQMQALEKELGNIRAQAEQLDEERRQKQELVGGEIEGLEQSWRATVGRAVEAEVAGDGLRREILARRRG